MPIKILSKDSIVNIGTIFLIWIGLIFVQFKIIGASFNYFPTDNDLTYFSYGLNWLSLSPMTNSGHPGPIFNWLSGLIVSTLTIDFTDAPLKSFLQFGIAIQGVTLLIGAIWFTWASRILALSTVTRFILLLTLFSFPPLLTFVGHWGYVFTVGILGAPLGLTLLAAIRGHRQAFVLGGVGCGFLAATYYPSVILIFAFLLAISLQSFKTYGWVPLQGSWTQEIKQQRVLILLIGISSLGAQLIWATIYVPPHLPLVKDLAWIITKTAPTAAIFLVSSATSLILIRWDKRFQVFILWTTVAFILGSSVLLPWYYNALFLQPSRGVGILKIFNDIIFLIDDLPWLALFWAFVLLLTYVSIRNKRARQRGLPELVTLPYDLLFIFVTIIPVAIAAATSMNPGSVPGIGERIFIAAIPAFTAGWALILVATPKNRSIYLIFIIVVFCLFVDIDWYRKYRNEIEQNRITGSFIDSSIENFFEILPSGRLLCIRNEYSSRYCSTAFAYNRYRTIGSAKHLPSRHLFDGKVIYIWPPDDDKTIEHLLGGIDTTYFVIAGEYVNRYRRYFLSKGAQVHHVSEFPVQAFIATNIEW